MRFNRMTRIAAAVAVIGAVAAGGAAFTDQTGQATGTALGYGTTSVTGGTIQDISYQLNEAGTQVQSVTLTSTTDLATAGYNGGSAAVYLAFDNDGFNSGNSETGDADCTIGGTGAQTGEVVTCVPYATTTVASIQSVQISITSGASNGDTFHT